MSPSFPRRVEHYITYRIRTRNGSELLKHDVSVHLYTKLLGPDEAPRTTGDFVARHCRVNIELCEGKAFLLIYPSPDEAARTFLVRARPGYKGTKPIVVALADYGLRDYWFHGMCRATIRFLGEQLFMPPDLVSDDDESDLDTTFCNAFDEVHLK